MQTSPKTYLVTGAAGFIGARFVESCQSRGISVISVDRLDYFQNRAEHSKVNFGKCVDLEDLKQWLRTFEKKPDAIVHLGAITDTREMDLNKLNKYNLEYSQFLWNYASSNRVPFIYASSAATYGEGTTGYEDHEDSIPQLKPLNPYGDSKQNFDLWVLQQKDCPPSWAGFKFFNVYGFGERHKGFMASVVLHAFDQIQETDQVTLFKSHREGIADGFQKRDFVSVEDVVDVLHFAIEKPIQRGIYNLGTGKARAFLELARAVFSALGRQEKIQFIGTPLSIRDKYQYFTEAPMQKLREQGYQKEFLSLEEGVRRYVSRLKPY